MAGYSDTLGLVGLSPGRHAGAWVGCFGMMGGWVNLSMRVS